jgi:TetR/AcrR family transcriptional regulator, cholesterol catabolism regulator
MKTRKGIDKRERILEAAARVIAEKGYAASTLSEIGELVGTHAGSLYYYFASKDALVETVLNLGTTSVSEPVTAAVKALPKGAGALQRIRTALDVHVAQMLEGNVFIIAYWKLIDQVPEDLRERHRALPRAYGKFWRGLMRQGQAEGVIRKDIDANLAQLFLLGTTIYALQWYRPDGHLTPSGISDLLITILFEGISVPEQDARKARPRASGRATAR